MAQSDDVRHHQAGRFGSRRAARWIVPAWQILPERLAADRLSSPCGCCRAIFMESLAGLPAPQQGCSSRAARHARARATVAGSSSRWQLRGAIAIASPALLRYLYRRVIKNFQGEICWAAEQRTNCTRPDSRKYYICIMPLRRPPPRGWGTCGAATRARRLPAPCGASAMVRLEVSKALNKKNFNDMTERKT